MFLSELDPAGVLLLGVADVFCVSGSPEGLQAPAIVPAKARVIALNATNPFIDIISPSSGPKPNNLYLTVIILIDKLKAGDYLALIIY